MEKDYKISKEIDMYLDRRPYIKKSLGQGIINYSALSRQISEEIGNVHFEAVKSAVIRTAKKYIKDTTTDKKTIDLLKNANFQIEDKIATIHHISELDIESIAYSKTPSGYMYFVKENIAKKSKYKKIEFGFAAIYIKSHPDIEVTTGVSAFLLSILSSHGINVVHMMDCREDTYIIIRDVDAPLAFKILADAIKLYSDT